MGVSNDDKKGAGEPVNVGTHTFLSEADSFAEL